MHGNSSRAAGCLPSGLFGYISATDARHLNGFAHLIICGHLKVTLGCSAPRAHIIVTHLAVGRGLPLRWLGDRAGLHWLQVALSPLCSFLDVNLISLGERVPSNPASREVRRAGRSD